MVYLVRSVAQTRHDIEKRVSVPLKGVKIKHILSKILHLNFSLSAPPKFANFPKFSKNHVLSFWVMSDLCHINSTRRYFHFCQRYKHFSEGTLNHNCLVYGRLKWQKSSFRGSSQIFIKFSICKSSNEINSWEFTAHKVVHSISEKNIRFTQKYAFLGKKMAFRNSQISPNLLVGSCWLHWLFGSCWYGLVAYLVLNYFKWPLNLKNIFNFEN